MEGMTISLLHERLLTRGKLKKGFNFVGLWKEKSNFFYAIHTKSYELTSRKGITNNIFGITINESNFFKKQVAI